VESIAGVGRSDVAAGDWNDALRRRSDVLDTVAEWAAARIGHNASASRVSWRALKPFLTMVTAGIDLGTVEAADTMVMTSYVLPPTAAVEDDLLRAVDEAARLLEAAADHGPTDIAEALAGLPRELRTIGLRGLPRSVGPLPVYAVDALERAARAVDAALASRWERLSVGVRRTAADATLSYAPPGPRTLAAAASAGSAVAAAAAADEELQRLLIVAPLEAEVVPGVDDENYDAMQAHHAGRAVALVATVDTETGLQLLADARPLRGGFFGGGAMLAFARELGRRAIDTTPILGVVDRGMLPGLAAELIRGLREVHPDEVDRWLADAKVEGPLAAAVGVSDDLSDAAHDSVLARAHAAVCGTQAGRVSTRPLASAVAAALAAGARETLQLARRRWTAARRARDLISPIHETTSARGPDADRLELGPQLARHLAWCRAPVEARLSRLAALAVDGPVGAVPAVMMTVSHILRRTGGSDLAVPDDALTDLVDALRRYLDARGAFDAPSHDVATGAAVLMEWAPASMALMLLEQLEASGGVTGLPYEWRPFVSQLSNDARARLVTAYIELLPRVDRKGDNVVRREALSLLARLGGGSDPLLALVGRWTNGSDQDLSRAAVALADVWHLPAWPDLVADLLAKGLAPESVEELLRGVEPHSFGPDIAKEMQPRLAALDRLAQRDVPAAREFAHGARARVRAAIEDYEAEAEQRRRGYT